MTPLLELHGVCSGYGQSEVLHDVNLAVYPGETVTVLGSNGAGKSTLLLTISGIARCLRGDVRLDGASITNLPSHVVVARGISQVPEGRRIFPRLTVRENIAMGAMMRRHDAAYAADLARIFETFPVLRERQAQPGGTLSGGEQQMLAMARALIARPRVLLLDEPSLGLAPLIVARIFDVIRALNQTGTTILLVEQNANMALQVASRAYVLESGRITLSGSAAELVNNDEVRRSYLGG